MDDLLRLIPVLAPDYNQTVIFCYPPFGMSLVDKGTEIPWPSFNLKFVCAGEVFSEEWRSLLAKKCAILPTSIVSIYGTADAGVLAHETPTSIHIRQWLAKRPDIAKLVFSVDRLPSLFQYDPLSRYLECIESNMSSPPCRTLLHHQQVLTKLAKISLLP